MKKSAFLSALLLLAVIGCDSNPTNAPTADAIQKANEDRARAIDNDKSMTPEGKAKMKEMLKLNSQPSESDSTKGR
ncbi:MAG: hypothetical protein ACOYON_04810 [Fimbriimonas sp.]